MATTEPVCWWPQWFHINVVFSEKGAQQRKLMVLLNMAELKIHTHTHCSAPHQGVKRPPFVVFTFPTPSLQNLWDTSKHSLRQLALLLFYMISLCDLFQIQIIWHWKHTTAFISTPSAVFPTNFITVSSSHVLTILLATNVIIAFLSTVVSATFLYLLYSGVSSGYDNHTPSLCSYL